MMRYFYKSPSPYPPILKCSLSDNHIGERNYGKIREHTHSLFGAEFQKVECIEDNAED